MKQDTSHQWRYFRTSRLVQVCIDNGADLENLQDLDQKLWTVLAASNKGLRFDQRTLDFLDSDGDGRVLAPDVLRALDFLKSKGVDLQSLFEKDPEDEKALAAVLEKEADLAKVEPSEAEKKALAEWEAAPSKDPAIMPLGENTAAGSDALAAVEGVVTEYFSLPDDAPLVVEGPEKTLPTNGNVNPKHADAIRAFIEKAALPVLGERQEISREDFEKIRAAFAPYRAWVAAKPVMNANAMAELEDEERKLRFKLHLAEYIRSYVNQSSLYDPERKAIYQTGDLYIDGRVCELCFHVDDEGAHSALAGKSSCCVLYLKLVRPGAASRNICAVVTAGRTAPLFVGRNGIFYDRDGNVWDAVVTRVVEAQVSLREAFWAPWRKMGEAIAEQVKKFVSSKEKAPEAALAAPKEGGGAAALTGAIAALGVGVGMMGAALAGMIGFVAGLPWWKTALAVVVIILAVSLPSVVLTWFKLRRRDVGAILNASGWAVNRPLFFTTRLARKFTRQASTPVGAVVARDPFASCKWGAWLVIALAVVAAACVAIWRMQACQCCVQN